jgi:hypothetical protein
MNTSRKQQKQLKTRQNFTISRDTLERLRKASEERDVSMSSLLTIWILEKTKEKRP